MSPPEWFCTTYTGAKECKHARFSIYSVDNRISILNTKESDSNQIHAPTVT